MKKSKECAYIAVFVALVIAVQLTLSALPGVELVTVLFTAYAFSFGTRRGIFAAGIFSLLRQILFGFFPSVLLLYLLYYSLLAALFGWLGSRVDNTPRALWWLVVLACVCTVGFTLLDCLITPLWYGLEFKGYFLASLPFMLPQVGCTAITVALLFLPLHKAFRLAKRGLK